MVSFYFTKREASKVVNFFTRTGFTQVFLSVSVFVDELFPQIFYIGSSNMICCLYGMKSKNNV